VTTRECLALLESAGVIETRLQPSSKSANANQFRLLFDPSCAIRVDELFYALPTCQCEPK
jgi:hypothetical protein